MRFCPLSVKQREFAPLPFYSGPTDLNCCFRFLCIARPFRPPTVERVIGCFAEGEGCFTNLRFCIDYILSRSSQFDLFCYLCYPLRAVAKQGHISVDAPVKWCGCSVCSPIVHGSFGCLAQACLCKNEDNLFMPACRSQGPTRVWIVTHAGRAVLRRICYREKEGPPLH